MWSYLSALEERVTGLERSIRLIRPGAPDAQNGGTVQGHGSRHDGENAGVAHYLQHEDGEQGIDAMGAVVFDNEEEFGFFGIHEGIKSETISNISNRSIFQHCAATTHKPGSHQC